MIVIMGAENSHFNVSNRRVDSDGRRVGQPISTRWRVSHNGPPIKKKLGNYLHRRREDAYINSQTKHNNGREDETTGKICSNDSP